MSEAGDQRFAPPSANVADVGSPAASLVLASRLRRLGAVLLDGLILWAVMFAISMTAILPAAWTGGFSGRPVNGAFFAGIGIAVFLIGIVTFVLINGFLLANRGQTIGKMVLGVRIVRPDGSKVAAGRVIGLRYLVNWAISVIPFLGGLYSLCDMLAIFRESRRCLHDEIADTIVIRV